MSASPPNVPLKRTPLFDAHVALGAKMVPFAGYEMPVQYPLGVLKEHLWTREKAGLFDVSHMGQAFLVAADGKHETVAKALESLVPADILNLKPGQQRYTQLLDDTGGILDDLMVTRPIEARDDGRLTLVVNAGCKDDDFAHIRANLPPSVKLVLFESYGLIALQGPLAARVLNAVIPGTAAMAFMSQIEARFAGDSANISRSGYTGEDGYEIAVPPSTTDLLWEALTKSADVQPIGLGARDSLRLEAGLCLYGHDIDTTTSPIEAGLAWSIQKRRREDGGFPGAARIQREIKDGPSRRRVGIRPDGAAPAREGAEILSADGAPIGKVTSGGPSPCLGKPIAMGYVASTHAKPGTKIQLVVRGKNLPAEIVTMPFVPHRYARGQTLRV
jgi:aminomethyltransferase